MVLRRLLAALLLAFSSVAYGGSVDISMSNHGAQFEAGYLSKGNAEFQSGLIYNDQGSVLVDTGFIANGGGQDGDSGFAGGGAVKAIAGPIKQTRTSYFVSCLALGGQVKYTFPAAPAFALVGEFLTALKITSFGDSDRFNQFGFRLEMGPPHAKFFLGYREITFDIIGTGAVSVDKGGYTGVLFSF